MEEKKYKWTFPHIKGSMSTANMMWMVLLALVPTTVFGVIYFGSRAFLHLLVCTLTCVLTEFTFEAFTDRPLRVADGSSAVTGVLLALMMPVKAPLWFGVLGGVFAIAVIKMLPGGLGKNRLNPALCGHILLLLLFYKKMQDFSYGAHGAQTLLGELLQGTAVDPLPMLLGNTNGGLGSTSALLILAGGVFLLAFGIINFRIPAACGLSFVLMLSLFSGRGFDQIYLTSQICGGGFILAVWFMAAEPVTSPITKRGQIIYGSLIGVITAVLRIYGVQEAVVYAVLLANLSSRFLDKMTVPRAFGQKKMVKLK